MGRFLTACLLLFFTVTIIGCALQISADTVTDYASFVRNLRLSGVVIKETGDTSLMAHSDQPVFSGEGKYIRLDDDRTLINVWEYSEKAAAVTEAGFISRDGFDIIKPPGPEDEGFAGHFDWIAPPHWYQSGRMIVLYVGEDPEIRKALNSLLGEQFAGHGAALYIK